ncbi:hypothetical protein AS029_07670 [Microbacterium enclense]|nr:hypothetical protein AS029_07670 [Microbacterium enclense]
MVRAYSVVAMASYRESPSSMCMRKRMSTARCVIKGLRPAPERRSSFFHLSMSSTTPDSSMRVP